MPEDEVPFLNPKTHELMQAAVITGLEHVQRKIAARKYIAAYDDFPKLNRRDDGSIYITKHHFFDESAPKDYTTAFQDDDSMKGVYGTSYEEAKKLPGWPEVLQHIQSDPNLSRHFTGHEFLGIDPSHPLDSGTFKPIEQMWMITAIASIVCRLIYLKGDKDFDQKLYNNIYREWETAVLTQNLSFNIAVPILLVGFEEKEQEISPGRTIVAMPDKFYLAMNLYVGDQSSSFNSLKNKATHALVLRGYSFKDTSLHQATRNMSNRTCYDTIINSVDRFFTAMRSVVDVETGYCEVISKADGWGSGWTADLPDISSFKIRAFSERLEDYSATERRVKLSKGQVEEIGKVWEALESSTHNSLNIASRRLNMAYIRNAEDDSILDLVIGLETLFVKDSGRGEVGHKFATRMANLVRLYPLEHYRPRRVFAVCKRLYDYRSKVAHGDSKSKAKLSKTLVPSHAEPLPTIQLGITFLRYAIRTLAINPKYLDWRELDFAATQPDAMGDVIPE